MESIVPGPDIEPQGWGPVTEGLGAAIRKLLQQREGVPSIVRMAGGEEIAVYDAAWGRDAGDLWEHVTANIHPSHKEHPVHFFFLSDVRSVLDPLTGEILISQDPAPGQR